VAPTEPEKPQEADNAIPGEEAKLKAQQADKPKPFKPPEDFEEKSWIEIELVDENDEPVPGERYRVTLPDGTVTDGSLDENGFAHIGGIDPGTCQITFPNLDGEAWEKI
jgi:hypothetical protein